VAFTGNLLADVATFAGAWLVGGARGSDVDLDSGGRFAVLFVSVLVYGTAQVILVGLTLLVFAFVRRGSRFWTAMITGWLGFALLSIALCLVPGNL
jgi:hypothetical protein